MSVAPLHSANWYRVASLHPNLQPGTRIQRQILRNEEWFIFTNPVTQAHFRLNRKAYELIARFDGKHSVDELWNGLLRIAGDDAPTQDEVIAVLAQLMESGLILFDSLPDGPMFRKRQVTREKNRRFANLNPFSFSLRLFDPSHFLQYVYRLQFVLLHPLSIFLSAILAVWALLDASLNWNLIHAYASAHLLTPRCLLLAWVIYPLMKAVHELGHALVVRHFGGTVNEVGVSFFLLLPAPYVDASAATAFPTKWQRMAVSSAGIAIELLLAACALVIWSITSDGIVRDSALVVMAIGSLSTIIFNGNPLLRMDGYHIFCDLLELPNLGMRSQRWWTDTAQHYIKGTQRDPSLLADGKEIIWLIIYAPASWLYRIVITLAMIQLIGQKSFLIALAAMAWMGFGILGKPLWKLISIARQPVHPGMKRWQPRLAAGCGIALVLLFLFAPFPSNTIASGVIWLSEQSQIRAGSDSQIASVLAHYGEHVTKGQPLVVLASPDLETEKKRLIAQIERAQTDQAYGWQNTQQQDGKDAFEKVKRLNSDLAQLQERIDQLTLRAEVNGTFILPHPEESIGTYVSKGTIIAHVLPDETTTIRTVISQDDIGRLKENIKAISVLLAEDNSLYRNAQVLHVEPAATNHLPSKALGDLAGSNLVTDQVDKEGLTLLEPVFVVDVQIPNRKILSVGSRATVRFEHETRPLAATILWHVKQLFLKLFAEEQ